MMKTVFAVAIILLIGACLPLTTAPNRSPNVDAAGTAEANLMTAVVQTLTAQPTGTPFPPTSTATPTIASEAILSSPIASTTTTAITATFDLITSTNNPAALTTGSATLTPTLGVMTYGTLPPAVPFSNVTLINRAKRQAYISLQVVTKEGGPTIIEYPVTGQIKIKAPIGDYLYVAWVGGRKMVGEFSLHKDEDLFIILYKDRVVIK